MKKKSKKLPVLLIKEENQYIVYCPAFSIANQGPTFNSALFKVKNGIELFLDEIETKNDFIPLNNN